MTLPIWLSVATAFMGLAEIPGPSSNPVIVHWAKELNVPYANDDEAWCALFLNRIMMACGLPVAGSSYDLLRAKSFATWGNPQAKPSLGSIMVFTRPTGGHVGLYLGETEQNYRIRGGNTANMVGDAWLSKSRLIAIRWPANVVDDLSGPVQLAVTGELISRNEA
jgi:uncharacterized protein (TIGR02594 family)